MKRTILLEKLRERFGTIEAAATAMGFDKRNLYNYAVGMRPNNRHRANRLAFELGMSYDALMDLIDDCKK